MLDTRTPVQIGVNAQRGLFKRSRDRKEIAEKIWLVSFMHYDLGFFDHETGRVECAPNPFGARLLPMSPEENGYHLPS